MSRSVAPDTDRPLAYAGSPSLYVSVRLTRCGSAVRSPCCDTIRVPIDEPAAAEPRGTMPVRKYRRPTSWVTVSIEMPRTTHILSPWRAMAAAAGPSRMGAPWAITGVR